MCTSRPGIHEPKPIGPRLSGPARARFYKIFQISNQIRTNKNLKVLDRNGPGSTKIWKTGGPWSPTSTLPALPRSDSNEHGRVPGPNIVDGASGLCGLRRARKNKSVPDSLTRSRLQNHWNYQKTTLGFIFQIYLISVWTCKYFYLCQVFNPSLQLLVLLLNSKVILISVWASLSDGGQGGSGIISVKLFHMSLAMVILDEFCSTDITFIFSLLTMSVNWTK